MYSGYFGTWNTNAVADPDLERRGGGGGGLDLLALSAIFPSVISSFFTQSKGGGRTPRAPPLDPPLQCQNARVFCAGAGSRAAVLLVTRDCLIQRSNQVSSLSSQMQVLD